MTEVDRSVGQPQFDAIRQRLEEMRDPSADQLRLGLPGIKPTEGIMEPELQPPPAELGRKPPLQGFPDNVQLTLHAVGFLSPPVGPAPATVALYITQRRRHDRSP